MQSPKPSSTQQEFQAVAYVGIAALLYSVVPLAIDASDSSSAPLTVGAGIVVGFLAYTAALRRIKYPERELSYRSILKRCRSNKVSSGGIIALVVVAMLNVFGYITFSWSTAYIDTAVTSSLYEFWPVVWFVIMRYVDTHRHELSHQSRVSISDYVLLCLGAAAVVLVVYSTYDTDQGTNVASFQALGIILALLAPILGGLAAFDFLLIDRIRYGRSRLASDDWTTVATLKYEDHQIDESINLAGVVLPRILMLPVVFMIAIVESGGLSQFLSWKLAGGVFVGMLLMGPAGLFLRRAHLISKNREVIALQYLVPILSLLWLALFSDIRVGHMDLLFFGTVAIMAVNMLINVDPETQQSAPESRSQESEIFADPIRQRYSLKALVVSLLAFGTIVYFRDRFVTDDEFTWMSGDYWAILALASTIFALLLAFRLTRVESLLSTEDLRTFDLIRRIEILPDRLFLEFGSTVESKNELLSEVSVLNRATSLTDYKNAYFVAKGILMKVVIGLRASDDSIFQDYGSDLASISRDIDALAHGRQHAREFAERMALWLIGGIIVLLALAVPSQPSGWARLLTEMFTILLASVVVFLLFHLADLRRSRADELVMYRDSTWKNVPDGLYVRFRDQRDYRWQRIFAGFIVFGIVTTVFALLAWDRLV